MSDKVFLVGNAHLDPVWQWCYPEGLALVKSTFKAALDRMDEYPDYVFTSACASYYKWVACTEPELFARIQEKVKEGRWCITGGMWVQPDCNIPSGESFSRHFLYSQRFFKEHFGFVPNAGYNVDSFGHNGMLPQLLIKAGIENYVYQRPHAIYEKPGMTTEPLHLWESPDGSRVLCWHLPYGYGCDPANPNDNLEGHAQYGYPAMFFYGVGNHGGGPTIRALDFLENLRKTNPEQYLYAGPDEYFAEVRKNVAPERIPVVAEDLQHHASGCYSANAQVKALNRRAEEALIDGEKMDVLAKSLTGGFSQKERIDRAWERVMFNQFHDILAGCSIKPAYEDAYDAFRAAALVGNEVKTTANQRISWRINTTKNLKNNPSEQRDRLWVTKGQGSPVVVFNPHSFPVKAPVSVGSQTICGVRDENDGDVPMQIVRAPYTDGWWTKECLFEAEVPAYGYRTYFVYTDPDTYKTSFDTDEFVTGDYSIENRAVKLVFDRHAGYITEFIDKRTGKNLAAGKFGRCVVVDDSKADTWGHMVFTFADDVGEFSNATVKVIENGPVRCTIKVTTTYNRSELVQYYSLTRGSSIVNVKVRLNYGEQLRMAKLSFPVNAEAPKAVYSMPFGYIEKKANGEEEPAQKWAALVGEDNCGVSLLNNGKYSFSANGNDLRMVIARGCGYLDHYGQPYRDEELQYLDQGPQEFEYAFMPKGADVTTTVLAAEYLNTPCTVVKETHHEGTLPCEYTGVKVDVRNVLVQAVKFAEDGNGYVIRTFETEGKKTDASVYLGFADRRFSASYAPQEVKTFFVPFDGGEIKEVLLTEYDIENNK